ncbi:MAG: LytTR family DNA-binding domain-containing protein [Pseudomonadota bacterium]
MTLQAYLQHRRFIDTAIVIALLVAGFLASVATELMDYSRSDLDLLKPRAWVLEGTSHLAIGLLIPLMIWFDGVFPLRIGQWRRTLPAHLVFTLVFSALHVSLMYVGRVLIYPRVIGVSYSWNNVVAEFTYEYLKDFRTYFLILALLYLYRFVLVRLQGEAGFLAPDDGVKPESPLVDRFLVKKLGREFLVRTADIDWIESSGNYVNLHVDERVYPLRGTMAQIADRLGPQGFIRVHRQAIVNSDRIAELAVFDSGDGELMLESSVTVPVSRRYRQQLREAMGNRSGP